MRKGGTHCWHQNLPLTKPRKRSCRCICASQWVLNSPASLESAVSEVKTVEVTIAFAVRVLLIGLAVQTALAQFESLSAYTANTQTPDYVNVREAPYSAAGDAKTDDARAIQAALDAVRAEGGGTALVGVARAPLLYAKDYPGTTLLAVDGAGNLDGTPFITLLGPNSILESITVFYPEQQVSDRPTPYPWTVRGGGGGDNVSIVNVLLANLYQAVDLATQHTSRHFVGGFTGSCCSGGFGSTNVQTSVGSHTCIFGHFDHWTRRFLTSRLRTRLLLSFRELIGR